MSILPDTTIDASTSSSLRYDSFGDFVCTCGCSLVPSPFMHASVTKELVKRIVFGYNIVLRPDQVKELQSDDNTRM